ncbi:MAG: carboxypeptidase regulatory-like domain-containing protein [Taibaiella sp.]|nr:carboxypeptidase regulatory-like domain-containing protein [Taibaiella sp.]
MKQLLSITIFICSLNSFAQNHSGGIECTATDINGKPVAYATITVRVDTIIKGGAITDDEGKCIIRPLAPGRYDVTFQAVQHCTIVNKGIIVYPSQNTLLTINNIKSDSAKSSIEIRKERSHEGTIVAPDRVISTEDLNRLPTRKTSPITDTTH